jgi:hypothetical protein
MTICLPKQTIIADTNQPVSHIGLGGLGAIVLGTPDVRRTVQLFELRGSNSVAEATQVSCMLKETATQAAAVDLFFHRPFVCPW